MKVCFETFGCRLNKAEALQQEAEYLAKGWVLTTNHADADLIVVRGCSVTARAQFACEKLISHLRRHYPLTQLKIEGCLDQRLKVSASAPRPVTLRNRRTAAPKTDATVLPTRTARAYLKVQDGCSGGCTFCIVPKFRGASVSVGFTELLDRARRFADAGYHEIVVTGCNLSLYASEGKRLPELLAALAAVDPDCRVRIGSLEPGDCAAATVDVMADCANICRFLHLPIQSGSNPILDKMGRPYRVRDVDQLITRATEKMPLLGLGCDIMTGFNGETELDYIATKGLLQRHPFSNVHVFPYSRRPGTAAYGAADTIDKTVRTLRARELSRLMAKQRAAYAVKFIGRTVDVVVEHTTRTRGWTGEYLPCEAAGTVSRKSLVKIAVKQFVDGVLRGRLVKA